MTWKQPFSGNWSTARWLRLVMGAVMLVSGLYDGEGAILAIGSILLLQSAYNFGCGMVPGASCSIDQAPTKSASEPKIQ